jgi:MFS family permease
MGPAASSERRIVVLSSAAHALVHAEMLVFAVALVPLSAEFGLSLAEVGFVGTLSYVCFGAGAPLAGWLADHWGARGVLVGCMLGSAAALGGLVLARGLATLAAAYVLLGLAASLYHPAGLGLLSMRIRALGPALAVHGMAGNLGLALTPVGAAALTDAFDWRAPYALLILLTLLVGVALLGLDQDSDGAEPLPGPPGSAGRGPLALLFALAVVLGLVYRGSLTFLPLRFLESFAGGDPDRALSRAGLVTSAALLGGMLGQLAGGRLLRTRPTERLLLVTLGIAAPLLAGIALLQGAALIGAAFLFIVAHFANQPLTNALLADYSHRAVRSRVYGISFTLSFGVGALAAGAGGLVAEAWGVPAVFVALTGLGAVAFLLGAGLWWVRREQPVEGWGAGEAAGGGETGARPAAPLEG